MVFVELVVAELCTMYEKHNHVSAHEHLVFSGGEDTKRCLGEVGGL